MVFKTNIFAGSIVFPGAGYIAMMAAASGANQGVILEDISFKSALVFADKETPKTTHVVLSSASKSTASVSISFDIHFFINRFFDFG